VKRREGEEARGSIQRVFSLGAQKFCLRDIKMKKVNCEEIFLLRKERRYKNVTLAFVVKTDLFCCQHFFTLPSKTAHLLLTLLLLLLPATTTVTVTEL
jgi:hypothetical protein